MRKRNDTLSNILRILTQLEKAINRLRSSDASIFFQVGQRDF
jgi:hypothetical protein